jgi:outer membrane lipoprotein-sorting protein
MCRSVHLFGAAAIAFAVALPASAQTVDEIVARNLQAKGGADVLRQTNAVKMTGTFKAVQPREMTMTMTSWAKRPNLRRQEVEPLQPAAAPRAGAPAGAPPATAGAPPAAPATPSSPAAAPTRPNSSRMVQATDGTTMWIQQGIAMPQTMPASQVAAMPQDTEFDSVFIDYQDKGVVIKNLGVEKLGGKDVFHLTVQRKTGPLQHYYLDTATGLEAKVSTEVTQGGATARVDTEMSDYRTVEGRVVPFRLRQSVNGQLAAEIAIEKVEFNVEMPDTLFKLPK